jgi:hypothetical protein
VVKGKTLGQIYHLNQEIQLNTCTLLRINGIFALVLKKSSQISSIITSFLAVLILSVSAFSGIISHEKIAPKSNTESKNKTSGEKNTSTSYFNKSSIEAVYSPVVPDFNCEKVVFLSNDFKFLVKDITINYFQIFERKVQLEVLFEHLSAPNAP